MLEFRFNKVTVFKTSNFIKKRLQHSCFPVKFAKFLKTAILKHSVKVNHLKLFKFYLLQTLFLPNFLSIYTVVFIIEIWSLFV